MLAHLTSNLSKWCCTPRLNPSKLSARALEQGAHYLAHDCLRIADDPDIDSRHKRIMVDTRLRLIGKWNAKRFGDKIEVNQNTSLETASTEEIEQALQQKLKELEAQVIDVAKLIGVSSADES